MGETTAKERVEIELKELAEKKEKLAFFILCGNDSYLKLSETNKFLLDNQLQAMGMYKRTLKARLDNWED